MKGNPPLIEAFPIRLPDGRDFVGRLYQTPHRKKGRRIIVDRGGVTVLDTKDCCDFGNAKNALDLWLAEQMKQPAPAAPAALTPTEAA
jgi:hypothetical protein